MDTAIAPRMLHALLATPDRPLVLDVRRAPAYAADERLLAGALRPEGDPVTFAAVHAPGRRVVAYCVHGHEVSREAARGLREAGFEATILEGGIEGWKAAGLPTLRRRPQWQVPGGSRWITRARPRIDRIACPWLLRRFIDPLATFAYVPAERVLEEARLRDAVAFDLPGAPVHHRGERCSFDALLEDFDLHDAALEALATIVRGADTDRPDLAPECAGLVAASQRLAQAHADDLAMLEHAMPLYDELYAACLARATRA